MKPQFFVLATATFLSFGVLQHQPVQAALIDQGFTVSNPDDPLADSPFTGSFVYEDSALTSSGNEDLSLESFNFNFLGQSFSDATLGRVLFTDGTFLGLDLSVGTPGLDEIAFSFNPGFFDTSDANFSYEITTTGGRIAGFADLTYAAPAVIPTPALLPGLMGLGLGFWRKRQHV